MEKREDSVIWSNIRSLVLLLSVVTLTLICVSLTIAKSV